MPLEVQKQHAARRPHAGSLDWSKTAGPPLSSWLLVTHSRPDFLNSLHAQITLLAMAGLASAAQPARLGSLPDELLIEVLRFLKHDER